MFSVDRKGIEIGALLVLVALATVAMTGPSPTGVESSPPEAFGSGSSGEAAAGASWAIAEVLFGGVILAAIILFRFVPDWIRTTAQRVCIFVAIYLYALSGVASGLYVEFLGAGAAAYVGYRAADHYGVYWLLNNALCLALAIAGGIVVGSLFGVPGMAAALVILTLYDHLFANRKEWMFDMAEGFLKARAPVIFLRPRGWRYRWDWLLEDELESDQADDKLGWGLGTADLALASGFVAALTTSGSFLGLDHGTGVLAVVVAGLFVAALRISHELDTRGSGAGMPPITAGLLVPYAILVLGSAGAGLL